MLVADADQAGAEKTRAERAAAEKVAANRMAAEKAEAHRIAAKAARLAEEAAEAERLVAEADDIARLTDSTTSRATALKWLAARRPRRVSRTRWRRPTSSRSGRSAHAITTTLAASVSGMLATTGVPAPPHDRPQARVALGWRARYQPPIVHSTSLEP